MQIAVGSDHRGFKVKRRIVDLLRGRGYDVIDVGTDDEESVDYPDFAGKVAGSIIRNEAERGILVCGTGLGMSIAANKYPGIRAAPVHDDITAELSRRHNDCNILCLSADMLGERLIDHIVGIWLETQYEDGRHSRRLEKITQIERNGQCTAEGDAPTAK